MTPRELVCTVAVIVGALLLFSVPATPQPASLDWYGAHPHEHGPDPYKDARSRVDFPCCHGADCFEWHGPEPEPGLNAEGERGLWFGPHFVREDQRMKVETLARQARGRYVLCISGGRVNALRYGTAATVYCGHVPESGV